VEEEEEEEEEKDPAAARMTAEEARARSDHGVSRKRHRMQ